MLPYRLETVIQSIKTFFIQQSVKPFETSLAFFFVYASITSMLNFGVTVSPLAKLLGAKVYLFYTVYLIAGMGMFFGVGLRRGDLEGLGLILLITCSIAVIIASLWLLGIQSRIISGYVQNLVFITASLVRLRVMFKAQRLINDATK